MRIRLHIEQIAVIQHRNRYSKFKWSILYNNQLKSKKGFRTYMNTNFQNKAFFLGNSSIYS